MEDLVLRDAQGVPLETLALSPLHLVSATPTLHVSRLRIRSWGRAARRMSVRVTAPERFALAVRHAVFRRIHNARQMARPARPASTLLGLLFYRPVSESRSDLRSLASRYSPADLLTAPSFGLLFTSMRTRAITLPRLLFGYRARRRMDHIKSFVLQSHTTCLFGVVAVVSKSLAASPVKALTTSKQQRRCLSELPPFASATAYLLCTRRQRYASLLVV